MKAFLQKGLGFLNHRAGDGPWRSKSVIAALAVVVIGIGIRISDVKTPARDHANTSPTNAPVLTSLVTTGEPIGTSLNHNRPFPFYVPIGVSYVAGFCIGWFFRKLIRLTLASTVLIITFLALGRFAGCDMTPTQDRARRTGEWAQYEITTTKDYLVHLLPSAGAGGAGVFLGFRRRGKTATPVAAESQG